MQMAQAVHCTKAWNDQLWGVGDHVVKGQVIEIGKKNRFRQDISRICLMNFDQTWQAHTTVNA